MSMAVVTDTQRLLYSKHKERMARLYGAPSRKIQVRAVDKSHVEAAVPQSAAAISFPILRRGRHDAWPHVAPVIGPSMRFDRLRTKAAYKATFHVVCREFGITVADLLSDRRTPACTVPRHIAVYILKSLTTYSMPQLGRRFANRDHTTILNSIRRVTQRMAADPQFAAEIQRLTDEVRRAMTA